MLSARCSYCHFSTPAVSMSETIPKPRGPSAGALNDMLVLPVMKSKVGLEDVSLVMSCLNIKPPCKAVLQTKLNEMSNKATEINEAQMLNNQRHIKHVTELAGSPNLVDIQFDVSYCRRPRGGMRQSFGAAIDHTTSRPLTIATAIANKHCRKRACDHQPEKCTKNYRFDQSIASSERSLLHQSLDHITQASIVRIRSVTTDASTQVAKALQDFKRDNQLEFQHYKCFVHILRTLDKNIKTLKLDSIPKHYVKSLYMQKLARSVRARVRLELQNLRALKQSGRTFVHKACLAIKCITKCLSGQHRLCRLSSTVCLSHLQNYSTKALPYGVHLELNSQYLGKVQAEVEKIFSIDNLKAINKLFHTNLCESLHAAVYTVAPKTVCWSRNFPGLCHSATHSRTLGPDLATLLLAKAAGIKVKSESQMSVSLKKRDRQLKYHVQRKCTQTYKNSRYFLRKRTASRVQYQKFSIQCSAIYLCCVR